MLNQTQLEHFRNLVSIVAADGEIREAEKAALSKIAYQRGIPLERFNIMMLKAHEYKFLIPQNQHDREQQLEDMIEVALVDGDISKAEQELIHMVAQKLGFTRDQVDVIIASNTGGK